MYITYLQSPIGLLKITSNTHAILQLEQVEKMDVVHTDIPAVLAQCVEELMQYFSGERQQFTVPISMSGTPFQQQVWQALQQIPYGSVCSYKEIAEKIGRPKAVRAVGNANNKNKCPIIVPCHRVIGTNGKLVGYALGLERKQILLNIEKPS